LQSSVVAVSFLCAVRERRRELGWCI